MHAKNSPVRDELSTFRFYRFKSKDLLFETESGISNITLILLTKNNLTMKNKHLFTILTASILFCILTFSCTKFEDKEKPGSTYRLRSVKHRLCSGAWRCHGGATIYADQSMKESNSPMDPIIIITDLNIQFSKDGTYKSAIYYAQDPYSNPLPYPVFYKHKQLLSEEGQWWFDKKDKTILYMTFDGVTEKMKITSLNRTTLYMYHIDESTGIVEDYVFLYSRN